ncbi:MAG: ABC transporter six-transmembrane domain-containing protein [Verrucomicrobiota bacterium]
MIDLSGYLSLRALIRSFRGEVVITWGLTLLESALFAFLPLLIGRSIDGLLKADGMPFVHLLIALAVLLGIGTGRRIYDTRAYGTMRVELGKALARRSEDRDVSVTNARVLMGRELVDFLEGEAPETVSALIQTIASIVILLLFHPTLAISAGVATISVIVIYGFSSRRFFRLNAGLNEQLEEQVSALASRSKQSISGHFFSLRRHEVRLSDTESLVYGLVFLVLLAMLAFNLWFAATEGGFSPGEIFSIVTYSFEFLQSAVALPFALQTLTRLREITERINEGSNLSSES